MTAPANDNFTSPIVISTITGMLTGSNLSASAEVNEPTNNQRTVWYRFNNFTALHNQFDSSSALYFSTRNTGSINSIANPFFSRIQVFTASNATASITQIQEINNLPYSFKQRYANYDIGATVGVVLSATGSTWIRIDGTDSTQQGDFPLSWGLFYNQYLGDCHSCMPQFDRGYLCVGSASFKDSSAGAFTQSFGSFPQGSYKIKYCGGAINISKNSAAGWVVYDDIGGRNGSILNFAYNSGSRLYIDPTGVPLNVSFSSQPEAENNFRCAHADFSHTGGPIDMQWWDNLYVDNMNGSPAPVFGLYRLTPEISASTACAVWNAGINAAGVTFTLQNYNSIPWSNVKVTLLSTGGVTSPSAQQTASLAANGTTTCTFSFTTATTDVTATLKLENDLWDAPITTTFYLGTVVLVTLGSPTVGGCFGKTYIYNATIRSVGYWKIQPSVTVSVTNGARVANQNLFCQNVTSVTYALSQFACGDNSQTQAFHVVAPAPSSGSIDTVLGVKVYQGNINTGIQYSNHLYNITVNP